MVSLGESGQIAGEEHIHLRENMFHAVISGESARTSHAQVVNELGREIIGGRFPVGSILPGDPDLASRFQVSRTVLREAMKTLTAKGLVVPRARIGTRVTPRHQWNLFDRDVLAWHFHGDINLDFLLHLSEMRLAFEPHAAGLAARNATEAQIERMTDFALTMADTGHTAESFAAADVSFHLTVAEASANPFMRTVGGLIEAALFGVFKLSSPKSDPMAIGDVANTHLRIAEAIGRRDETEARRTMEQAILDGRARLIDLFGR